MVMVLFWILPAFNLVGKWETYLSFSLYSGNNHTAKIILSDDSYKRLPPYIKHYVQHEGAQYILYPKDWCLIELKTPLYPEKRVFENVFNYVKVITNSTNEDVKLVYIEKLKLFDKAQ